MWRIIFVIKRTVARVCRWGRRLLGKWCTIDLNKDARGLANCLVRGELTKEERIEKYNEQLLLGVNDSNKDKVMRHFNSLSKEIDPMEKNEEISDNSIKKIKIDISEEDVLRNMEITYREFDKKKANMAINGLIDWPVPFFKRITRKE